MMTSMGQFWPLSTMVIFEWLISYNNFLWVLLCLVGSAMTKVIAFQHAIVIPTNAWPLLKTSIKGSSRSKSNATKPEDNGRNFAEDIFRWMLWIQNIHFDSNVSKFVADGPIDNTQTWVVMMAWCHQGTTWTKADQYFLFHITSLGHIRWI